MKKIKPYNVRIKGIRTNSKEITKNDLFICLSTDDRAIDYISEALNRKASAVIASEQVAIDNKKVFKVKNTYETLFDISSQFYKYDNNSIKLIGITGTDGKTTTATIIKDLLSNFSPCSYLGTNGFEMKDYSIKVKNTTPKINDIIKHIIYTIKHNGKAMSMEVSSEGLYYHRCDGLLFDVAILTNITKDHLNTHQTIKNYVESKSKLFTKIKDNGIAIVNANDRHYKYIVRKCSVNTLTYGTKSNCDAIISNIIQNNTGIQYDLTYNKKTYTINSSLRGKFNAFNLTAAILTINFLGISIEDIISKLNSVKPVKGRFELLDYNQPYEIVLDYAHTINATKIMLENLKATCRGKLITVVGCAGGRDKTKRKDVGKYVCELSDYPILTEDDPRYEDVLDIIKDMTKLVKKKNYIVEPNRETAIKIALDMAKKGDTVAILGKGDDQYMARKDRYVPYSDRDIITKYFTKKEH